MNYNDIENVDNAILFITKNIHSIKRSNKTNKKDVQNKMNELLNLLNININEIPIVHIAGTKGKGSTCTLTENILRNYNLKTGLYTSPHLISATERIRINGEKIDNNKFLESFKYVWSKLLYPKKFNDPLSIIGFFHVITLIAFDIFVKENVNVIILEVGMGGRLDATNVCNPIVCGITTIDYDHTNILGDTLELIAKEKAGIMKKNIPCYCLPQVNNSVENVFIENGKIEKCNVEIIKPLDIKLNLKLKGEHQLYNAYLSIYLSKEILKHLNIPFDLLKTIEALNNTLFDGRSQIYNDNDITYYLDGAHTPKSILLTINWFKSIINSKDTNILIFNINYEKQIIKILEEIPFDMFNYIFLIPFLFPKPLLYFYYIYRVHEELPTFSIFYPDQKIPNENAILIPNDLIENEQIKWLKTLSKLIYYQNHNSKIYIFENPLKCINYIKTNYKNSKVFITGSLYLVGDILKTLNYKVK